MYLVFAIGTPVAWSLVALKTSQRGSVPTYKLSRALFSLILSFYLKVVDMVQLSFQHTTLAFYGSYIHEILLMRLTPCE